MRRLRDWLQLILLLLGLLAAVVHVDRRITRLEDRVEEEIRLHLKMEQRLERLEGFRR